VSAEAIPAAHAPRNGDPGSTKSQFVKGVPLFGLRAAGVSEAGGGAIEPVRPIAQPRSRFAGRPTAASPSSPQYRKIAARAAPTPAAEDSVGRAANVCD